MIMGSALEYIGEHDVENRELEALCTGTCFTAEERNKEIRKFLNDADLTRGVPVVDIQKNMNLGYDALKEIRDARMTEIKYGNECDPNHLFRMLKYRTVAGQIYLSVNEMEEKFSTTVEDMDRQGF